MYEIQWFKMEVNIFANRKIQLLLQMTNGDSYFRVWIQLITIAVQCNNEGMLLISHKKPMTIYEFASIMGKSEEFMREIISKFLELDMLTLENDVFVIKNWNKYQSIDRYQYVLEQNRKRQAKYREKLKSDKEKSNVIQMLGNAKEEKIENTREENNNGFRKYEQ